MKVLFSKLNNFLLVALLMGAPLLKGQQTSLNTGAAWMAELSYAGQLPGGDLASRFGSSFSLGSAVHHISAGSNILIGIQGQFLFGSEVKEDVLQNLRTEEGFIIGNDRTAADVPLRQRGYYLGIQIGKLWSLSPGNPRSGLHGTLGAGLLRHRIRIQEDPQRAVPQIQDEYAKGYDRLSGGPALYQWLGYQIFSRDGRINAYIGVEALQGFTRGLRDIQFDTRMPHTEKRMDLLWGLRAGWVLPFYSNRDKTIWY